MKHLRKYENKTDESEFDLIKEILLEIKDSYSNIDGEIHLYDEEVKPGVKLAYIINLDCSKIKLEGDIWSLGYYENKMKFMSLVIEVCKRLETALSVKVKIPNFDDFDHWQHEEMKIQLIR